MITRAALLSQARKYFRRHLFSSALSICLLLFSLTYFYLLPRFIGGYYLPGLWERYDIGHMECKVKRIGFRRIELQDLYFWNEFNQECSINRGVIRYRFTPWGTRSLLEITSVRLFGFHAGASYFKGKFKVHGIDLDNLSRLNKFITAGTAGQKHRLEHFAVKNSHMDFFVAGRRLHLPFTLECNYVRNKGIYQLMGYLAPRGEYSILESQFAPSSRNLTINLKNENINLGCFNDFLPENFSRHNIVGRLVSTLTIDTGESCLKTLRSEFMTGKPDDQSPRLTAAVLYENEDRTSGQMKFQFKLRQKEGVYTASSQKLAVTTAYPYLNCQGSVISELYPAEQNGSSLILPSRFAVENKIKGQFSMVNFKWELTSSGIMKDGLTALHQTYGRIGCSGASYQASLSGRPGARTDLKGVISLPALFLQDQDNRWDFNNTQMKFSRSPEDSLKFRLSGDGCSIRSPKYRLKTASWDSNAVAWTPKYDFQIQGKVMALQQQWQGHEIICPQLCFALHKHPQESTVYLNVNSPKASLQSPVHGYFTDCLQLNWNWLFNPGPNSAGPDTENYLRCQCLKLPHRQTAQLDMRFQQQYTTACWNGKIHLQSPDSRHIINLDANMHWPQWRQLPFMALHADMPRHLMDDLPFLQKLFPGYLYAPEQNSDSIISIWMDSIWFNGKLRTRSGFSHQSQPPQHSSLPMTDAGNTNLILR